MVLLIAGPSRLARQGLAEKLVREQGGFKHIPFEGLEELLREYRIHTERQEMNALLAAYTAQELEQQSINIIFSATSDAQILSGLRSQLTNNLIAVYLGSRHAEEDTSLFDYCIDSAKNTLNDAYETVVKLLKKHGSTGSP